MEFDPVFASELMGKLVYIHIKMVDFDGVHIFDQYFYGTVNLVDEVRGIHVTLHGAHDGGYWHTHTHNLGCFEKAEPGVYALGESGDIVQDPDYICKLVEEFHEF